MQTSNQRTQNNNFPLTRLNPFGAFLSESLPHSGQHTPCAFSPPCLPPHGRLAHVRSQFSLFRRSPTHKNLPLATFCTSEQHYPCCCRNNSCRSAAFCAALRRHLSAAKPPRAEHQTVLGSSSLRVIPGCPPNCGESSACWSCQIPDSAALSCAPPCMPANAHSHPP